MSRPWSSRNQQSYGSYVRINGRIRAREVRVVADDGQQLGVLALGDAITLARSKGLDLVEVAPNANPPVCRVVDYGKFRYEQSKKEKEHRKHQHANRVKEIQLRPAIDPHDLAVKLNHAIDFLCDDMKLKISLRFRGREMAHKEFGFQVVQKFLEEIAPYGHKDAEPKLVGRGLNVMVSPLPRNKRAQKPEQTSDAAAGADKEPEPLQSGDTLEKGKNNAAPSTNQNSPGFVNNPFTGIDVTSQSSGA